MAILFCVVCAAIAACAIHCNNKNIAIINQLNQRNKQLAVRADKLEGAIISLHTECILLNAEDDYEIRSLALEIAFKEATE